MNEDQKQLAQEKIRDLINGMFKILTKFSIDDKDMILLLANHLDILLTQKKYGTNGDNKSLLEYVYGDIQVPEILSIKTHIENNFRRMVDSYPWVNPPSKINELCQNIHRAHSFILYNGLPKLVITYPNELTSLEVFLATPILLLKGMKDGKPLWFSIADIIKLIRNKETAHYEHDAHLKHGDKFSTLFHIKDRYTVILAISEYIMGVYEKLIGDNHWCMIEHFSGNLCMHYDNDSLHRSFSSSNASGPIVAGRIDNGQDFFFLMNCRGQNFTICQITPESRIVINDKGQGVIRYNNKEDIDLPLILHPAK